MKSIASEVRKTRSRSTSGLAATVGGTAQHPLLSEILAADKRRWKAAQQMTPAGTNEQQLTEPPSPLTWKARRPTYRLGAGGYFLPCHLRERRQSNRVHHCLGQG